MSDLKYTVEVTGLKDVEQLEKNLDRLHNTLNAGQGSGKSLEEMRKILVGMRGQSSVISDLRDSVKGLNSAAEQLGASFDSGFKQLDRTFKQGFQLVLDRVNMFGAESGKSLSSGAAKMFNDAGAAAQQGGKSLAGAVEAASQKASTSAAKGFKAGAALLEGEIKSAAAAARAAATAAYTNLVDGDGLMGIDKAMAGEISRLRAAGATISKYHADILKGYEQSHQANLASEQKRQKERLDLKERHLKEEVSAELKAVKEGANFLAEQRKNLAQGFKQVEIPMIRNFLGLPSPEVLKQTFDELKGSITKRYRELDELKKQYANPAAVFTSLDDGQLRGNLSQIKNYYKSLRGEMQSHASIQDQIVGASIGKQRKANEIFDATILAMEEKSRKELNASAEKTRKSLVAEANKVYAEGKAIRKEYMKGMREAYSGIQEPKIREILGIPEYSEVRKTFAELKEDIIGRHVNMQKEIAAGAKLNKDYISEPEIRKLLNLPEPTAVKSQFKELELQIRNSYKQLDELKKQFSKPAGVYSTIDTKELVGSQQQLKEYHKSLQTQMQSHEQVVDDLRSKALNKQRIADQVFLEAQKGHATKVASLRSQQAKEATAAYSKLVEFDPAKKLTPKLAEELSMLKRHGAGLSQWHNEIINEYRQYGTLYLQEMDKLAAKKQRKLDAEAAKAAKAANVSAATGLGVAPGLAVAGNPAPMLAYASSVDKARDAQDKLRASSDPLRSSLRALAVDGNDTHSAMRGLASGFNLLWLTWGNLAPLFAGAAISNGFMQTAKQGMEVAHTLEVVATLGENSTESMKDLTSELIRLGQNGPRGPLEIAEAFKTLSLAGLDANKILAVTGTVLNFSTSGTTSLQTAADVLVSVTTAFGTGAAGFERSADIITRAAADSKASVESFGEAMKTASVAGEQYGAKQEDVALLIQLLAQVGIQGSAAGTSVRNMYADITGRSGQVGKILKSLKLDFKDLDGNVVSTVEQMRMLDEVLKQYDSKSQGNIIQAIYGERGAKAAIAALQAYRTAAQDSSKYANKLEEDFAKVANAAADSAIAAARLGQTSQKAFETAGATMRTTMFEAFREIEPQLYMTAVAFQEAFGSAETRELLQSMTSAVATLGMAVAENLEPIAKVAILWAEYRLALFAVNNVLAASAALKQSYAAVTKTLTAATVADTTATALNNAAKASPALAGAAAGRTLYTANVTASTGAVNADTTATAANTRAKQVNQIATAGIGMTVLKALPVVGNAIALASVAWMVFKSATDDAGSAVENYAQTKSDKIAEKLEQEAEHLRRVNEERLKGIGLMEAEARVRESYDREASVADLTTEEDKLRSKLNNLNALKENIEKSTRKGDQGVLDAVVNNIQATDAALTAAMVSRAAAEDRFDRAAAERRKRTKESNDIAVKEAADQAEQLRKTLEKGVGGLKTWSLTDFQGGAGGADGNSFVDLNRDKELQALKAHYDAELAVANDYYSKSKQLLDGHRSANLISEEEYMVQSLQLSRSHEAEQLQVLEASLTAYTEASERRRAALESQMSGAQGKGKNMLLDQLRKETQEFEIFVTNYEKERAKVAAESYARVGETVLKLQTEVGKLLKSSEDFWDNAAVSSAAQKDADELAKKYKNMNTSILSMDSAMFEFEKAQKSTQSEVKKMNAALEKQLSIQKNLLKIELLSLQAAQASGRLTLDEAIQRATLISQFKEGIAELEGKIADNTEKGLELGAERGWDAFQKMREKQVEELANSMSEAVVDGLMSGDYKSIGKNIRDILQRELIRKRLTAVIYGVMDGIVGGISNTIFGGGGSGGLLGMASNGMSLYNTYQNAPGYINRVTSFLGLGGGNAGLGLSAATAGGAMWGGTAASTGLGLSAGGTGLGMAAPTAGFWAPGTASVLPGAGAAGAAGSSGLMAGLQTAGPWIAGAVAIAAAFGAFRKTKVVDTGIMGTLGVKGGIHDFVQKRKGGSLFSGPKYSIEDHGVSAFDKPMQDAFSAMRTAAIDMGKILGLATDHLKDFTTVITLDSANSSTGTRGLNLKGLSDAEVQAKVQQALEQANNEIAQQLIGSWESVTTRVWTGWLWNGSYKNVTTSVYKDVTTSVYKPSEFAREGETAIETLTRLAQSLSTVNGTLDLLGLKLYEASLAGGDMASKLVDLFGGLEAFTSVTSGYYQNFYSEEERFRKAGETVNEALRSIGVELDVFGGAAAKVKYRELVEKAFAEGNQELAAQLLQMSAAFSEVANAAEEASAAAKEAAKLLVDNALANLEAAVERVTDGLQEQISTLSEAVEAHKKLGETLKNAVRELRNEVASTSEWSAARGMVYIEDALSKARSGSDTLDFKDLEDAIAAARGGISEGAYVSQFDRDRDALVLAGQLEELGELNGEQLSTEEKQLRILKEQLEYYEAYLQSARDMVNGVNTLIDKTLSPEQAYALLLKSMSEAQGVGKGDLAYDDYIRRKADALTDPAAAAQQQLIKDVAKSFEGSNDPIGLWKAITAAGGNEYDLNALYGWAVADLKDIIKYMGDAAYEDYLKRKVGAENDPTIAAMQQAIKDAAKPYEGTGDVKGLWESIKKAGGNEFDLSALYGWAVEDIRKVIKDVESAKPSPGGGGAVFGPGTPTSSSANPAYDDYNNRSSSSILGGDAAKTQMDIRNAAKQYEGTGDVKGLWDSVTAAGGNQYDLAKLYGWDVKDIENVLSGVDVPGFSQGINVVPHDMFAQIHKGEAIIPKRYNPFNPGNASAPGGVNNELVSELRSLHETIYELKTEVAQLKGAAVRTAKNTEGVPQLVDQFDEVTEGGNVLRTEVV